MLTDSKMIVTFENVTHNDTQKGKPLYPQTSKGDGTYFILHGEKQVNWAALTKMAQFAWIHLIHA